MPPFSIFTRLRRSCCGATATEFALIMPVFTMMVFALIEVSLMMFRGASVQWALDRAARQIITNPDVTQAQIKSAMQTYLEASGVPEVTVTLFEEELASVPVMRVQAHYNHLVRAPFLDGFSIGFDFSTVLPKPSSAS